MYLNGLDYAIIITYFLIVLGVGLWISKLARNNLDQYFLGGNKIKWYFLGLSNASGMFDISGVMWTVTLLFVYGLKSAWINFLLTGHPIQKFRVFIGSNDPRIMSGFDQKSMKGKTASQGIAIRIFVGNDDNFFWGNECFLKCF